MKILLVNCVNERDFAYAMPLAVAYLTSYIKGKFNDGIYVKTVSIINQKKILSIIKNFEPDVLGLSTTTSGYDSAKFLAKETKKINKDIIIVTGGTHITLFENSVDKNMDYAVSGEGEQVFYDLLKYLFPKISKDKNILSKEKIPGLIYWNKGKLVINPRNNFIKNLDDIGHPDRRLINPNNNMLFTSRGCPFNCIFCSSPIIWKRTFRMHSAEYVFEEIKILYNLKHSVIWFGDDLFTCNKDRIKKLIKLMKTHKLLGKVSFIALGRSEVIDEEMVQLLKELNVLVIQFGFETGDDKILKYAKNSQFISVEKNKQAAELCKKYGILVQGYAMLGFPEEGHKEVMKSYHFFKRYSDSMDRPNIVTIFPGTRLQDELKQQTGKDYAKIHLEKTSSSLGGEMPVTTETNISRKLSPDDIKKYREMFHKAGIIKNKIFYMKLFFKLLFSKGIILNMYYLYNVTVTAKKNPKREYISKTIRI